MDDLPVTRRLSGAAHAAAADDRAHTLDDLAESFLAAHRRGERPKVSDWAERHPALADEIRQLFPAVAAMERLKGPPEPATPRPSAAGGLRLPLARLRAAAGHSGLSVPIPIAGEAVEDDKPPPDLQLAGLRLVRVLGRGGMGVVYEAVQKTLKRHVAVKVIPFDTDCQEKVTRRFKVEARAAANLHHTNIVPVYYSGRRDRLLYYVMQQIDGRSLDRLLASAVASPLPPWEAQGVGDPRTVARIGMQTAGALQYAHEAGVLHRDIKPGNLILDRRGTIWVTDFGLATRPELDRSRDGRDLAGTLRYMAPERFEGRCDWRSDVYSLGITLYELLALRPAFHPQPEEPPERFVRRVRGGKPAPLRQVRPDLPIDLVAIVDKAIARRPHDRYPTAGQLAEDLHRYLEGMPVRARRYTLGQRLARKARRHPLTTLFVAATFVSALFVGALALGYRLGGGAPHGPAVTLDPPAADVLDRMYRGRDTADRATLFRLRDYYRRTERRTHEARRRAAVLDGLLAADR